MGHGVAQRQRRGTRETCASRWPTGTPPRQLRGVQGGTYHCGHDVNTCVDGTYHATVPTASAAPPASISGGIVAPPSARRSFGVRSCSWDLLWRRLRLPLPATPADAPPAAAAVSGGVAMTVVLGTSAGDVADSGGDSGSTALASPMLSAPPAESPRLRNLAGRCLPPDAPLAWCAAVVSCSTKATAALPRSRTLAAVEPRVAGWDPRPLSSLLPLSDTPGVAAPSAACAMVRTGSTPKWIAST